jgi:hypothetical protein
MGDYTIGLFSYHPVSIDWLVPYSCRLVEAMIQLPRSLDRFLTLTRYKNALLKQMLSFLRLRL